MTQQTPTPHRGDAQDRLVQASELLNAQETADGLGISLSTLSRRVADGVIVPLRRDPLIFHRDDVRAQQPAERTKR